MALSLSVKTSSDRRLSDLSEYVEVTDIEGRVMKIAIARSSRNKVRVIFDADESYKIVRKSLEVLTKEA